MLSLWQLRFFGCEYLNVVCINRHRNNCALQVFTVGSLISLFAFILSYVLSKKAQKSEIHVNTVQNEIATSKRIGFKAHNKRPKKKRQHNSIRASYSFIHAAYKRLSRDTIKIQRYIQRSIAYLCIVILPYTALKYIIFALRMKRHYSKIESYDLICFFPSSFFSSFAFRSLYAASHSMLSVTVRCISFCHLRVVFAIFLLPFRFNRTRDFRIPAKLSRSNVCKS